MNEANQDEAFADELAAKVLQSIADSEPDEDTYEAQVILEDTPYAHMYVLNGEVIEKYVSIGVSNALADGLIVQGNTSDRSFLEGVAARVWEWRKEAEELERNAFDPRDGAYAAALRECADELAHSIPAALVAAAGRD